MSKSTPYTYYGKSTDTKPIPDDSVLTTNKFVTFSELDTGNNYYWDEDGGEWAESSIAVNGIPLYNKKSGGGGGGGGTTPDFATFTFQTSTHAISCDKTFEEFSDYIDAHEQSNDGFYYTDVEDTNDGKYAWVPITLKINDKEYKNFNYNITRYTVESTKHSGEDVDIILFEPFSFNWFARGGNIDWEGSANREINISCFAFAISEHNDIIYTQSYYMLLSEYASTFGEV